MKEIRNPSQVSIFDYENEDNEKGKEEQKQISGKPALALVAPNDVDNSSTASKE